MAPATVALLLLWSLASGARVLKLSGRRSRQGQHRDHLSWEEPGGELAKVPGGPKTLVQSVHTRSSGGPDVVGLVNVSGDHESISGDHNSISMVSMTRRSTIVTNETKKMTNGISAASLTEGSTMPENETQSTVGAQIFGGHSMYLFVEMSFAFVTIIAGLLVLALPTSSHWRTVSKIVVVVMLIAYLWCNSPARPALGHQVFGRELFLMMVFFVIASVIVSGALIMQGAKGFQKTTSQAVLLIGVIFYVAFALPWRDWFAAEMELWKNYGPPL